MNNTIADRIIEIEINNSISNIQNLDEFLNNIVGSITRNIFNINQTNYETTYTIEYEIIDNNNSTDFEDNKLQIKQSDINLHLDKYRKINSDDKLIKSKMECSICINTYRTNEYKRILECGHVFHKRCIDKWIKIYNSCPICRKKCIKI